MLTVEQYNLLTRDIQLLETNITEFGGDASRLNFYSQPAVFNVLLIDHYFQNDQNEILSTNHLFNIFNHLITLSQTIKSRFDDIKPEEKNIFLNVLYQGIELTQVLTEQYLKAHLRPSVSEARDYEDALQKLGEVIKMTDASLTVSRQAGVINLTAPTVKEFRSSVTELQNFIEDRSERFMREHPYVTAFLSSVLTVVGTGMFLAGLMILPAASLILAAAAVLSVAGVLVLSFGLTGLVLPMVEKCKQPNDSLQLFKQTSKMASSLRAMTKTSSAFFLPKASKRNSNVSNSNSSSALTDVNRASII